MILNHKKQEDIDHVELEGQLVMSNAAEIRDTLKSIIEQSQGKLLLDISAVSFVDSSGLSVLVSALKAVREKQGELVLVGAQPSVQSLIELTRLHQVFKLFADSASAQQHLLKA